jgi:hypothetical protein
MGNEGDLFPSLLKALSDVSDDVVRLDLQLLAQIASATDADYFSRTVQALCKQFNGDRKVRACPPPTCTHTQTHPPPSPHSLCRVKKSVWALRARA